MDPGLEHGTLVVPQHDHIQHLHRADDRDAVAVHTSQVLHAVDISDHHHAVVVVRLVLEVGGTHTVVEDENGEPLLVEYSRPKDLP